MLRRYGTTQVTCAADSDDELAFLNGIVENLSASRPKLVYADWLEERGDPRGPFLREFVAAGTPGGRSDFRNGLAFATSHASIRSQVASTLIGLGHLMR